MHEYPVTLEIIRLAEQAAKQQGAEKVELISLVIGDLSGYVGDSVRMYFDVISKGTPCEGCRLSIRRIETKLKCASCGKLFKRKPYSFDCPYCGGEGRPTDIGKEFYIDYIEVEKSEVK
jgi:hydrogenase nickel incorporation protein HypA/HybF